MKLVNRNYSTREVAARCFEERKKVERGRWRETPRTASPFPDTVAEKDERRECYDALRKPKKWAQSVRVVFPRRLEHSGNPNPSGAWERVD